MGQKVGVMVQERFGKLILELGGNNAFIVDKTAEVDSVVSGLMSGCLMTTGQSCSATRRLVSCCSRRDNANLALSVIIGYSYE